VRAAAIDLTTEHSRLPHPRRRRVLHLVLSFPAGVSYRAGNVAVLHPTNAPAAVERTLTALPDRLSRRADEEVLAVSGTCWRVARATLPDSSSGART